MFSEYNSVGKVNGDFVFRIPVYEDMQGKGAANYCVFLTEGKELFVRCYHRYSRGGKLIERQRYVFAKDGYVRYIYDEYTGWRTASRFREPVFCQGTYGYTFDNSYCILGFDAVEKRLPS